MHNDSVGVHGGVTELRYLHGPGHTLFLSSLNSVSRDDHQVELLCSHDFLQAPK
jgi:putative component of toxin-antitoxin plasmid stabilization module